MGIHVRPIGELEPPADSPERLECWKCEHRFEVALHMVRVTCPQCGSPVALQRLKMPTMPTGRAGGESMRAPAESSGRVSPLPMAPLEQATPAESREPVARIRSGSVAEQKPFDGARSIGWADQVEKRREMFQDSAPRMDEVGGGLQVPQINLWTLLVSVAMATVLLLTLLFLVEI